MVRDIDSLLRRLQEEKDGILSSEDSVENEAAQLAAIEQDIQAVNYVARLLERYSVRRAHPRLNKQRRDSQIGTVVDILRAAGRPLHVRQIIKILNHYSTGTKKVGESSITPRLAKLAKQGRIFGRTAKGTYRLLAPSAHSDLPARFATMQINEIIGPPPREPEAEPELDPDQSAKDNPNGQFFRKSGYTMT